MAPVMDKLPPFSLTLTLCVRARHDPRHKAASLHTRFTHQGNPSLAQQTGRGLGLVTVLGLPCFQATSPDQECQPARTRWRGVWRT